MQKIKIIYIVFLSLGLGVSAHAGPALKCLNIDNEKDIVYTQHECPKNYVKAETRWLWRDGVTKLDPPEDNAIDQAKEFSKVTRPPMLAAIDERKPRVDLVNGTWEYDELCKTARDPRCLYRHPDRYDRHDRYERYYYNYYGRNYRSNYNHNRYFRTKRGAYLFDRDVFYDDSRYYPNYRRYQYRQYEMKIP